MPLTGDWKKAGRIFGKAGRLMKTNVELATKRNGMLVRDEIKKGMRRGRSGWEPNSPLTREFKGSSKPLIDHGDLLHAIDSTKLTAWAFFVGVHRASGRNDGVDMATLAAVHEYGKTITPVKAQALAIPVSREASNLAREHGGVGEVPGLFRPKGTSILAVKDGKGFKMMFILKDEVVIPPRPFIEPGFHGARNKCKREWERAILLALKGKRYVPLR